MASSGMGDDDELDVYLRRGVESGLTRAQIAEALTHLAFYAGWPKATQPSLMINGEGSRRSLVGRTHRRAGETRLTHFSRQHSQ